MRPAKTGIQTIVAVFICMLFVTAGCGVSTSLQATSQKKPVSDSYFSVQGLVAALDQLPVPSREESAIGLFVQSTGDTAALVDQALSAYIDRHGLTRSDDPSSYPRMVIRVDTLEVRITDRDTSLFRREINRQAYAALVVSISERAGITSVYTIAGVAEDRLLPEHVTNHGRFNSFVRYERIQHPARAFVKPAGMIILMTAFLWTLYFYRG